MNKNLIVFMPSIEGGGVEKNLFLICNYLIKKIGALKVITISNNCSNKFDRSVKIVTFKSKRWDRFGRKIKYFLALILLIKEIIKNKKVKIPKFGTFILKKKNLRIGRNPKTLEKKIIKERNVILFRASKYLKNCINNNE